MKKLRKQLLSYASGKTKGLELIAVEPHESMRAKAVETWRNVDSREPSKGWCRSLSWRRSTKLRKRALPSLRSLTFARDSFSCERRANQLALISLNLDHPVLAIHEVGSAGAAFFLELSREILEKNLGLGETIDDGHGFAPATLLFDSQNRDKFVALLAFFNSDIRSAGALGFELLASRAFLVELGIARVNEFSV